jgi:hypothetical protein
MSKSVPGWQLHLLFHHLHLQTLALDLVILLLVLLRA